MNGQLLGDLISSLDELTVEKKRIETDLKLIESRITDVEQEIMRVMDADGIKESASGVGKVSLKTSTYPQFEKDGWNVFEPYVLESRTLVLLQHRIAVLPYREQLSLRRPVPGVVPVDVRKLTYRPLNDDN
jgi:hypothetical protein